jgi:monoamine oxidase
MAARQRLHGADAALAGQLRLPRRLRHGLRPDLGLGGSALLRLPHGEAANATADTVLTAPDGNAWLARGLAGRCGERIVTGAMACRVDEGKHAVAVDVLVGEQMVRYEAQQLVWAAPLFILPRLWPAMPAALRLRWAATMRPG